jgi:hypothetical protein
MSLRAYRSSRTESVVGLDQIVQISFSDRLIWTPLAENKPALSVRRYQSRRDWLNVAQHVPGFPVGLGGINEPHAAFRKESRKRRHV